MAVHLTAAEKVESGQKLTETINDHYKLCRWSVADVLKENDPKPKHGFCC